MNSITCTVFFEAPFYVGVFERVTSEGYSAAKHTFGAEPKDAEVFELINSFFGRLEFSKPVPEEAREVRRMNPKRLQREAEKTMNTVGIGTKAQQALKAQYEANKTERKAESRAMRELEAERLFNLKQEKRKAKHRGH